MKPYADIGNYTTFPNPILDLVMPLCDGGEWKVVCATIRLTLGWHKEADRISLSQFLKVTGIGNKVNLLRALNRAVADGHILREPSGQSFTYSLNREYELPAAPSGIESVPLTGIDSVPVVVSNRYPPKKLKDKLNKTTRRSASAEGDGFTLQDPVDENGYPEEVWDVLHAFCECWHINPPPRMSRPGAYWLKTARDLKAACGPLGAGGVRDYYASYRKLARPYSVATPGSIVNMLRAWAGEHSMFLGEVPGLWVGG
jgi:hypothetical protein